MADILTDLRSLAPTDDTLDALSSQFDGGGLVLMMLGQFMFSVSSAVPQEITHEAEYRWPTQDVIGRAPTMQYLGPGETRFELPGRIYPHYKGGVGQVRAMRELAGRGLAHLLVDALGNIYGDFAITRVAETQSVFDANNAPRRVDFRLQLTRSGV